MLATLDDSEIKPSDLLTVNPTCCGEHFMLGISRGFWPQSGSSSNQVGARCRIQQIFGWQCNGNELDNLAANGNGGFK